MEKAKNRGISMITLVITIAVIIILAGIAIGGSLGMINDASKSKEESDAYVDNDNIRSLLMHAVVDKDEKIGIPLVDGSLMIVDSGDKEYGTGYYLIPGGTNDEIKQIKEKSGYDEITKYKNLTSPYIVDYDNGTFVRIDELKFK